MQNRPDMFRLTSAQRTPQAAGSKEMRGAARAASAAPLFCVSASVGARIYAAAPRPEQENGTTPTQLVLNHSPGCGSCRWRSDCGLFDAQTRVCACNGSQTGAAERCARHGCPGCCSCSSCLPFENFYLVWSCPQLHPGCPSALPPCCRQPQ